MALFDFKQRSKIVVSNLPYLRGVLSPLDTNVPWSELARANYASTRDFARAVRAAFLPIYAPFRGVPHLPYETPDDNAPINDNQAWYFLNGICTDRPVLNLNGKALANLFNRRINLMHNPSDGIVLDLLECIIGRTMQIVSDLDSSVAYILEDALRKNDKVVLISHSQGGIITTGALYKLAGRLPEAEKPLLKKLEVYTFSSAATELDLPEVYAEHFFHTQDYVSLIGIAASTWKFSGRLFWCPGSGHLLNNHYLNNLTANRFRSLDGEPSRLLDYMRHLQPVADTDEAVAIEA